MSSLADRTIAALRSTSDRLLGVVGQLSDEQLVQASAASEWTVAQVLSHLGSGAEIGLIGLEGALSGAAAPEPGTNEAIWDRWNAMTPREQASEMPVRSTALVEAFEALTSEQRENMQVQLAFLPFPLPIAAVAGMRLNELALHAWDVEVALDPSARIADDAAAVMIEQQVVHLSFMLGFTAKPAVLEGRQVLLSVPSAGVVLELGESVAVAASSEGATATLDAPAEAVVRLLSCRLPEDHPVTGNVTLDELRQVFPGY